MGFEVWWFYLVLAYSSNFGVVAAVAAAAAEPSFLFCMPDLSWVYDTLHCSATILKWEQLFYILTSSECLVCEATQLLFYSGRVICLQSCQDQGLHDALSELLMLAMIVSLQGTPTMIV